MKKEMIKIGGKDYSPLLVGWAECCLNCDVKQEQCHMQCHYFEDSEDENVALKEVRHKKPPTIWDKIKTLFMPIEADPPF